MIYIFSRFLSFLSKKRVKIFNFLFSFQLSDWLLKLNHQFLKMYWKGWWCEIIKIEFNIFPNYD